ncbi:trichohyalin-like [Mytilus californianus]|uniref:trichohyalin-like n=1 Tax=Mytilus californianus TaxID=6549 RepID=UPI0022475ED9|nr:trichohyalin-like [Mytilus californianus]
MSDQRETRNVENGKKEEARDKEVSSMHLNDDITNQENAIKSTNASIDESKSGHQQAGRKDENTNDKNEELKENINKKNNQERNDLVYSGSANGAHQVAGRKDENKNVKDEEIKENINEKDNQDGKDSVYSGSVIAAVGVQGKDPRDKGRKHTENHLTEKDMIRVKNDDQENTYTDNRILPITWKNELFEQQNSRIVGTIRNLEPITSHIRMEEIQWQRLLERKLTRKNDERELEQSYRDEIQTQIRKIEKKKKTDNLMLKRRMVEFEKRRRANNFAFCRMLQRKDKEFQIENDALQQRILEIEKQKQKNVEKLKTRVSHLEEKKQREQEVFLQRMQELEHKREEEFEASQKRFQEIEKRKYNERKAWLLHVQKIEGLKKEVFKRSVQSLDCEPRSTDTFEQSRDQEVLHNQNIVKNVKDQARVMENVSTQNIQRTLMLPKIPKRGLIGKVKTEGGKSRKKKEKNYGDLSVTATEKSLHSGSIQDDTEDLRQNVTVSN